MVEKDGKIDSWKKTLKFISNCAVCKFEYQPEAVKSLDGGSGELSQSAAEQSKFFHFTCYNCRTNFMAMLLILPKGVSTVGMITDLNFSDAQKFQTAVPLTVDELIEARQFINSKNFKM